MMFLGSTGQLNVVGIGGGGMEATQLCRGSLHTQSSLNSWQDSQESWVPHSKRSPSQVIIPTRIRIRKLNGNMCVVIAGVRSGILVKEVFGSYKILS